MIKIIYKNKVPVAVQVDGDRITAKGFPPGYFEQIVRRAERYLNYMQGAYGD